MIEIIMRIAYDRDLDHTDAPGVVMEYIMSMIGSTLMRAVWWQLLVPDDSFTTASRQLEQVITGSFTTPQTPCSSSVFPPKPSPVFSVWAAITLCVNYVVSRSLPSSLVLSFYQSSLVELPLTWSNGAEGRRKSAMMFRIEVERISATTYLL